MDVIQRDLSPSALVHAIEANTAAWLLALGRAGGGEERDDPSVQWVIGGSPIGYHNCVVRANLTRERADVVIRESLECMAAHSVSGTWHVGPSMKPFDLGERLVAQGFTYAGDEPGMAVELDVMRKDLTTPVGLTITRVRDEQGLELWTRAFAAGFNSGEREAQWVGSAHRRIGLGDDVPWRHLLGMRDGVPVATASLFLDSGVAGIYLVSTVPEARRQGIGSAITLAALREAHERGYRIGVLGATKQGYSVYQRLGFKECCSVRMYTWRPG